MTSATRRPKEKKRGSYPPWPWPCPWPCPCLQQRHTQSERTEGVQNRDEKRRESRTCTPSCAASRTYRAICTGYFAKSAETTQQAHGLLLSCNLPHCPNRIEDKGAPAVAMPEQTGPPPQGNIQAQNCRTALADLSGKVPKHYGMHQNMVYLERAADHTTLAILSAGHTRRTRA